MNETNPSGAHTVQVPPKGLAGFYNSVKEALLSGGLEEKQLDEVFVNNLRAECVECGFKLTGTEL